ncbi:MAG TPA: hypothetical protein ENI15_07225 [Spirochaetes bacterium]|nr:hypothetical protein [Spirochaetota bacterium]
MKAAVYYNHKDIRIEELQKPEIGSDEVLIRVKACGICGSDVHLFEGKWTVEDERLIMGHEFSGVVEETGDNIGDLKAGDRVVILGAGSMGLLLLQLALMAGASRVLATDVHDIRLNRAAELGADLTVNSGKEDVERAVLDATDGIGADVVIEAAGTAETASQTVKFIRRGGKVCLFGVVPQEEFIRIKPFELYYKEAVLVSSFCNPFTFQRAIELLRNKKINVTALITHRYPLVDIKSAFKTMLEDDRRCKVIIEV